MKQDLTLNTYEMHQPSLWHNIFFGLTQFLSWFNFLTDINAQLLTDLFHPRHSCQFLTLWWKHENEHNRHENPNQGKATLTKLEFLFGVLEVPQVLAYKYKFQIIESLGIKL
jgi:hypothetical protein